MLSGTTGQCDIDHISGMWHYVRDPRPWSNRDNVARFERVVSSVAYKGSGKKGRIQSGQQSRGRGIQIGGPAPDLSNFGAPKKSKKQSGSSGNSRKTHDTKGRNNHGRSGGYGR